MFIHVKKSWTIARRYLVTNGFDGALTMLGLMAGFHVSGGIALPVAISACLGAAVALFMSGISSAYLSEAAERKKELIELEGALLTNLQDSDYGQASRYVPILVALVNGFSPLLISLVIIAPLWFANWGFLPPFLSPFILAMSIALGSIFLLGVFLSSVSGTFWLWNGLRTLMIAAVTLVLILFIGGRLDM
jgi:predicted membrane protein (TIGR00267 family)